MAVALAVLVGCSSASPAGDVGPSAMPVDPPVTADVPSPSPSDTSVSSAIPTSPPTSASTVAAPFVVAGLGPDTVGIVVATDGLRVRTLPTVGEGSQGLEPLLPEGARVYSVAGPVIADGYAWYQVQPYGDGRYPFGWVAGGSRAREPWIDRFPLGCDSVAPSPEGLVSGEPLEHLFCSLDGEPPRTNPPGPDLAIEGDVYCTLADDHWGALSGPDWIDQLGYCELRTASGSMRLLGAPMTRLLGGPSNPVEGRFAIVGHFDDPRAGECTEGAFDEADEPDPAQVVLRCRTFFVVTESSPTS